MPVVMAAAFSSPKPFSLHLAVGAFAGETKGSADMGFLN